MGRNKRRSRQRRGFWWWLVLGLSFLFSSALGLLVGVIVYQRQRGKEPVTHQIARQVVKRVARWVIPPDYAFSGRDRLNVLVIGVDYEYDRRGRPLPKPARSDTILIISFLRDGAINLLSIPRDTLVRFRGRLHRINAVHAISGPEGLQDFLASYFGVETHHFVQVTYEAFVKLVDLVGGVDLFVEYDMHYDDNWGNLHIHLRRGFHHLDGRKALGYVRYRKGRRRYCPRCKVKIRHWDPTGDLGRMKRQQRFLRALATKILTPQMVLKLPQLIAIARKHLVTDMDTRTMLSLANFIRQLKMERDIRATILPCRFVRHPRIGSVAIPDRQKAPKVLAETLGLTFHAIAWEKGEGKISAAHFVFARSSPQKPLSRPKKSSLSRQKPQRVRERGKVTPGSPEPFFPLPSEGHDEGEGSLPDGENLWELP